MFNIIIINILFILHWNRAQMIAIHSIASWVESRGESGGASTSLCNSLSTIFVPQRFRPHFSGLHSAARHKSNAYYVFDPQVGLKRFFNEVINLFNPTRGSNNSRITNSLPLFSLLNHTLNFHNWRLFCVLQSAPWGKSGGKSAVALPEFPRLYSIHYRRFLCLSSSDPIFPFFANLAVNPEANLAEFLASKAIPRLFTIHY